jgi:hypothetical protein
MVNPVINELLNIYSKMENFEVENDLGELSSCFCRAKQYLYLTIRELLIDTEELKRLQNRGKLVVNKDYNGLLNCVKNKKAKDYLEQYIKSVKEFKAYWRGGKWQIAD